MVLTASHRCCTAFLAIASMFLLRPLSAAAQLQPAVTGQEPAILSGVCLFRANSEGQNQGNDGHTVGRGAWTTILDFRTNGFYNAQLFLALSPNPSPGDFLSPATKLAIPLKLGENVFYFFGDGDDTEGGKDAFGLNLYFDSAQGGSPSISAVVAPGKGQRFFPEAAAGTCSPDMKIVPGSGRVIYKKGNIVITLRAFEVTAASAESTIDRVNSAPFEAFRHPPHSNGTKDTYGNFVLEVQDTSRPAAGALKDNLPRVASAGNRNAAPVSTDGAVDVQALESSRVAQRIPVRSHNLPLALIGSAGALLILGIGSLYLIAGRNGVSAEPGASQR